MILKINVLIAILVLLLLSLVVIVEGKGGPIANVVHHHKATNVGSPWLNDVAKWRRPRPAGCKGRPWICRQSEPPGTRMRCCRNQCVDVFSDPSNCGRCSSRCPFTRQCCRGFCSNTYRSRINCGKCGNRCPWGVKCRYGMCGYATPWPRPPRPPKPWPPHRPPRPWPPHRPPRPPCPPHGRCPPSPPYGDQPPPMSTEDL